MLVNKKESLSSIGGGCGYRIPHSPEDSNAMNEILNGLTDEEMANYLSSNSIQGLVRLTKESSASKQISTTKNLVVLDGREFVAQKISDIPGENNYLDYKIRYFGYGSGGSTLEPVVNKIGPFGTDTDLKNPAHFNSESTDLDSTYKYIDRGYKKRIFSDGSAKIINEEHLIMQGTDEVIETRPTAIKYTLKIDSTEIKTFPFNFSEAALYYTKMQTEDGVELPYGDSTTNKQNAHSRLFSRFTTAPKMLEEGESLTIEWFILA